MENIIIAGVSAAVAWMVALLLLRFPYAAVWFHALIVGGICAAAECILFFTNLSHLSELVSMALFLLMTLAVGLQKTLSRYEATQKNSPVKNQLVAVDTGTGLVLLAPDDILYISKEQRKTVIHCIHQDYTVPYSLEKVEMIFEDYHLFRTHQSFLVPLSKIISVQPADFGRTYMVQLVGGKKVPMSRIQYKKLRGHLTAQGIRIL